MQAKEKAAKIIRPMKNCTRLRNNGNTKYGLKIAADIENSFVVFFPQRMLKFFNDEEYFQKIVKEVWVEK